MTADADLSATSLLPGPLAGLRVLELADEKGQFCGKLMADLGADVLKIEPPGGQSSRAVGPAGVVTTTCSAANASESVLTTQPAPLRWMDRDGVLRRTWPSMQRHSPLRRTPVSSDHDQPSP
jgi:hypothetical protein